MGFSLTNNPFTKLITDRYTDGGAGINNLDFSNIAKDLGAAGALYGVINPNDSSGLASFFGTGGQQQPVGYTGGIPNYTATRELAPNAFASTYTTPTGEVAPRRPGMAGRRYFTDTTFEQSTDEPFMGVTAEQIAAQNQAAIDDQALFESILGNVENQRIAGADTTGTTGAATTGTTGTATTDTTGTTFPEGLDGNGVVSNSVLDGFGEVVNTTGTGQLTSAQLKQAVLDGTMDYNAAYKALGVADAVNPFGFTDTEQMALGIHESQRTGQGYKYNSATGSTDLYNYDTGAWVGDTAANAEELDTFGTVAGIRSREEIEGLMAGIKDKKWTAGDVAEQFNVAELDVLEELLRSGFYGYEDNAIADAAAGVSMEEEELVVQLLRAGKTNFAEVAEYYQDQYPGITAAQVAANYNNTKFAQGGNVNGYYLGGATDGMSDQIPATIDNMQPAALSDGEFVIPADVVSHLGNGNSDSGAKNLYSMMDRIRQDRTGTTKQGRQIDPNKYLA